VSSHDGWVMGQVESAKRADVHQRFREMYEATLAEVYGFLSLRVGGDRALAEDLTADAYAAAVRRYNAGRSEEVTISWLITVARRRLIDHWRKQSTAANNVVRLVPAPVVDDSGWVDHHAVVTALSRLSHDERAALVLRHVDGYSVADVAELLGRTPKATESLLGRARTAFRTAFEEANHD
jgi:RNA polymerase sigma-70 factor (ECF subfamily)